MSTITESLEFRGVDYRLVRLDPIKGGRLALRVGKVLAGGLEGNEEGIAKLIAAVKDSGGEDGTEKKLSELFGEASLLATLAGGVANLDTDLLFTSALECITGNLFAGQVKLHDDTKVRAHFAEHPDHLLMVMAWALRVNCAGFFVKRAAA